MLIRFSIENFLSFKDRTEFSMIAGRSNLHKNHIIASDNSDDIPLLKTSILYGANASGKSNFVQALEFAKRFILRGTRADNQPIVFKNFRLDTTAMASPSRMEFEIKHKGRCYAYGFVIDSHEVKEEWLYQIFKKKKDRLVYQRTRSESNRPVFDLSGIHCETEKEKLFLQFTADGTRRNQLFITECRTRNVKDNVGDLGDILNVIDWFQNSLKIIFPQSRAEGIEFELQEDQNILKVFQTLFDHFNTGIQGIELVKVDLPEIKEIPEELKERLLADMSENTRALITGLDNITYALRKTEEGSIDAVKMMTKHSVQGSETPALFEVDEESDGTQRLIDFIPALIDLFQGGNVYVIDEIDRSLHPNLTYELIQLFLTTPHRENSQLIATTHESSLLSQKLLRKDEIWFVRKDEKGISSFYSLQEFKVRFDKEIRKDYLLGRYRAIPIFGSRSKLDILTH